MPSRRYLLHASAFTIMELLVAVVVLGILTTLTMAGVSSAKGKARAIERQNNLRQHGIALQDFLSQVGAYPLITNSNVATMDPYHSVWQALGEHGLGPLDPTIAKSVHNCPSGVLQNEPRLSRPIEIYAYNANGLGRIPDRPGFGLGASPTNDSVMPVSEGQVLKPTDMIAFGDGIQGWNATYEDGMGAIARNPDAKEYDGSNKRVPARHQGRAMILFCDGHTSALLLRTLFADTTDEALSRWNRDNLPHRERLK